MAKMAKLLCDVLDCSVVGGDGLTSGGWFGVVLWSVVCGLVVQRGICWKSLSTMYSVSIVEVTLDLKPIHLSHGWLLLLAFPYQPTKSLLQYLVSTYET